MPAKPSLFDSIVAENAVKKGPVCSVQGVLANLSPEDAAGLIAAFANPDIKNTAIRRALADRGMKLTDHTVSRHRRGECLCEPK